MARKEDKLRPYRVDYFDIPEMKADRALVRSTVVRAVTAQAARDQVQYGIEAPPVLASGRIIIRSYRYYKNVPAKKEVFKPVEDLFTTNKAIDVMEVVEKFRLSCLAVPLVAVNPPDLNTKSSVEDNIARTCGTPEIASKDNYADPDVLPRPINIDEAAPILTAPTAVTEADYQRLTFPDKPVIPTQPAVFDGNTETGYYTYESPDYNPPPANEPFPGPAPLWLKLALFGGVAVMTIIIVLAIIHCGH